MQADYYKISNIFFNPSNDYGEDHTAEGQGIVPEFILQPVSGEIWESHEKDKKRFKV
jgi:hypothetical protein